MSRGTLNDVIKLMATGVCHFVFEKADGSLREVYATTAPHLINLAFDEKEFNAAIVQDMRNFLQLDSGNEPNDMALTMEFIRLRKNIKRFDAAKAGKEQSNTARGQYLNVWDINGQKWVRFDRAKFRCVVLAEGL